MKRTIRQYIEKHEKSDAVWLAVGYIAQAVFTEAAKGMELTRAKELRQRLEKLGYLSEDL